MAVSLGLLGTAVGGVAGVVIGALVARIVVCNSGEGLVGQPCSMAGGFFSFIGLPLGALLGAIVGAIAGILRPRASPEDAAEPLVRLQASTASRLAIVGAAAIELGAFLRWRSVIIPQVTGVSYDRVLTFHAEVTAFYGGLGVILGGMWRMLRPRAKLPSLALGLGCAVAIWGVTWGIVDLINAPDELESHLFIGYWISAAGAIVSTGWFLDRREQRSTAGEFG